MVVERASEPDEPTTAKMAPKIRFNQVNAFFMSRDLTRDDFEHMYLVSLAVCISPASTNVHLS
jgi:hypothetical protein